MNRKQKRWARRHKSQQNRENYLRNRRRWAPLGPPVVMDDPTEAHAKALCMEWLAPRQVLYEVEKELGKRYVQKLDDTILETLKGMDFSGVDLANTWIKVMHGLQVKAPSMMAHIVPV